MIRKKKGKNARYTSLHIQNEILFMLSRGGVLLNRKRV